MKKQIVHLILLYINIYIYIYIYIYIDCEGKVTQAYQRISSGAERRSSESLLSGRAGYKSFWSSLSALHSTSMSA